MGGNDLEAKDPRVRRLAAEKAELRRSARRLAEARGPDPHTVDSGPGVGRFLLLLTISGAVFTALFSSDPLHSGVNGAAFGASLGLVSVALRSVAGWAVGRVSFSAVFLGTLPPAVFKALAVVIAAVLTVIVLLAMFFGARWIASETGRQGMEFIWNWRF